MNKELKEKEFLYKVRCKDLKENKKYYENMIDIYKKYNNYFYFKDLMTETDFNAILKFKRNRYYKRYHANKKLTSIVRLRESYDNIVVFGTCTFNDNQFYLNGDNKGRPIQERTRTKKVNEWIKEHCIIAIANIDYGEKNEREHHHFIGVLNANEKLIDTGKKSKKGNKLYNLENQNYKLGFEPDLEIVQYDLEDLKIKKISNYLVKINNHFNKSTTKNRRLRTLYNKQKLGVI